MNQSSSSLSSFASSSSHQSSYPTNSQQRKYDVFLSFRGEDTRDNFTSHLYKGLNDNKIMTFIDNGLVRGEETSPSLLEAIEQSKISVVVLSENYASSKWCLRELVKILDCRRNNGQMVIPVFYRVHPSHVRNQTGSFGAAFVHHEESLKVNKHEVQKWRDALKEVAGLSGLDSFVIRPESELIKGIIKDISEKLNQKASKYYYKGLVGFESRIDEIKSLLCLESSDDVRVVGIWGMGGLGKTTIARAIYDEISPQFHSCCFLHNTREQLQRCELFQLRDQLFSALIEKQYRTTSTLNFRLSFLKDQLCWKKVLIVVDDAHHLIQLQELLLASEPDFFGPGSRIIVTSRDKQVLINVAGDKICTMRELNDAEALQLFSMNAFKQDYPPGNRKLQSEWVINYTKGNLLAVKVLGSALFGKSDEDWDSALKRLEKITNQDICNVLRTSYDGLDPEEQNIFLDIACFFRGRNRSIVTHILNSHYSSAHIVVTTLVNRSLITVSSHNHNNLEVHDLIQQMGQKIVLDESKIPENRSRLWVPDDICYILKENKGTEVTEGITLDLSKLQEIICLKRDAFTRMSHLRYLIFYSSTNNRSMKNKMLLSGDGLHSFPNQLRFLHWWQFPMKSLPSKFNPEDLVVLDLRDSKIKKLWTGIQNLVKLKEIDLSGSKYLTKIPDLSKAKMIEKIHLNGYESLEEVHSSIQHLDRLEFLGLADCHNLMKLPSKIDSKVLKGLAMINCPRIKRCPEYQAQNMGILQLDFTAIKEATSTLSLILSSSMLFALRLDNCATLSSLPDDFFTFKSLFVLELENWSGLESLPEIVEPMDHLFVLELTNCRNLKSLPDSICKLTSLENLHLHGTAIREIPSSIEHLSCLKFLDLSDCKYLESLPSCVHRLPVLRRLKLTACESLHSLPELPLSLETIDANNCKSLNTVSSLSFIKHCNLRVLKLAKCLRLELKTFLMEAQCQAANINSFLPFSFLYSGSEVPGWFSNQSMGASITMQFPSNLDHFKAIAFCVVFEFTLKSLCI